MSLGSVIAIVVVIVLIGGGAVFALMAVRQSSAGPQAVDRRAMRRDAQRRRRLDEAKREAVNRGADIEPASDVAIELAEAENERRLAESIDEIGEVERVQAMYAPDVMGPPDPIEVGITRRQVLNRSALAGSLLGLGAFGGASLAFLIPPPTKGFGGKIKVPATIGDIKTEIETKSKPYYVAEARTYLQLYAAEDEAAASKTYARIWDAVQASGLMPLFQKCPHLGCRVPWCDTSQWFECPCHGSQYNKAGEKQGGPAPRGMDRFEFSVSGATLTIDTGALVEGPTIGTDTIAQKPEGEHCVG